MIDKEFCDFLEYEICRMFEHSGGHETKGFWCDGVILSETDAYYSKKFVNDNRRTRLKAFIGKDGQAEYELILHFGNKALSRYARGLDLNECIPDPRHENWFTLDVEHKKMEIQLH